MSQQLTFSLSYKEALEKEDFFFSQCNLNAATVLGNWDNWTFGMMVLVGPKYSGKTHLCSVWAKETNALRIKVNEAKNKLDHCLRMNFVCIEDINYAYSFQKFHNWTLSYLMVLNLVSLEESLMPLDPFLTKMDCQ